MLRRRDLLLLAGGIAASSPAAAEVQRLPVVGLLTSTSPRAIMLDAFREGLGEAGYVDGRNVVVEHHSAEGHYERLAALATELVRRRVTVIAAMSAPTVRPARAATTTIPIVFYAGFDPVALGFVHSLGHPGGNITGISAFFNKLNPKRVELLRELLPDAAKIGLLVNLQNPNAARQVRETQAAVQTLALHLVVRNAGSEDELTPAFAALAAQVDCLLLGGDPLFGNRSDVIIGLAARHRLPTIYYDRQFVDRGGLISYGDSIVATWHQAGLYVGKILKGAKPAELPVEQPTRFELVINLKTARALGLTVPRLLLMQASEVIQ
jgi:ABC-type uncharacterized transport system substrate-binding protein